MSTPLIEAGLPDIITVNGDQYATELLIPEEEIQGRVNEMGSELAGRYADRGGVHVLTVMNGALHFASDLRRAMVRAAPTLPVTSDQVKLSSYAGDMQSSGIVHFQSPPSLGIEGKHVLIAEDVLDSGLTLDWLRAYLDGQYPASVEVAVALQKDNPSRVADVLGSTAVHTGFEIGNEFVVGYGLDADQQYRDLSDVYTLTPLATALSV